MWEHWHIWAALILGVWAIVLGVRDSSRLRQEKHDWLLEGRQYARTLRDNPPGGAFYKIVPVREHGKTIYAVRQWWVPEPSPVPAFRRAAPEPWRPEGSYVGIVSRGRSWIVGYDTREKAVKALHDYLNPPPAPPETCLDRQGVVIACV